MDNLQSAQNEQFSSPSVKTAMSKSGCQRSVIEMGHFSFSSPSVRQEKERSRVFFAPLHYEKNYAYPLLIWLHGRKEDEQQLKNILPLISLRNYVAAAPRGFAASEMSSGRMKHSVCHSQTPLENNSFSSENQTAVSSTGKTAWAMTDQGIHEAAEQIFDCIAYARKTFHIAKTRVFLAGSDVGGSMALKLGTLFPDAFAGVASLGGCFPQNEICWNNWMSLRQLPMLLGIGQLSSYYSPQDAAKDLRLFYSAGLSVSLRQYNACCELTPVMLEDLNRWMMDIVCGET